MAEGHTEMEFSTALLPRMAREGLYFVTYLTNTSGQWWGGGAGVVICLARVADLYMAQLMPLSLASVKSRLIFWLTRVVVDKGPLNGLCVCVCMRACV